MSLRYTLLINGPVYGTQSSRHAYSFACQLLKKGHQLTMAFFYQGGVINASDLVMPASDEFDLITAWQDLAQKYNFRLEVCVAAALRRGVLGLEEAKQQETSHYNLAEKFELVGLGNLSEALLTQDRVIQF